MKTVSQTLHAFSHYGIEDGFALMAKAGYEAFDLSLCLSDDHVLLQQDYRTHCDTLRALSDTYRIPFLQAHAPFPSYYVGRDEWNAERRKLILQSFDICARLSIPLMVIHPINMVFDSYEDKIRHNVEFYRSLLPIAKEYNVKIATENMWRRNPETNKIGPSVCSLGNEFAALVDAVDDPYLVACLDLGHAPIVGEDVCDMIRTLGHDRLQALHVHDNDGKEDDHSLPFSGKADWNAILDALVEIDYVGNMTLEADYFLSPLPREMQLDAHRLMASSARCLRDQFIQKRSQKKGK
jgi:sugar phosphate isomerase/epimerase